MLSHKLGIEKLTDLDFSLIKNHLDE